MAENDPLSGWRTFLLQLHERHIDSVVIGGAALSLHGLPRTTLDIDLVVAAEQLGVLFEIMDALKWNSRQASLRSLVQQPHLATGQCMSFNPPDGADLVDVFLTTEAEMNALATDSEVVDFIGIPVRIVSLRRLRSMKLATGRAIDRSDVAMIDEILND